MLPRRTGPTHYNALQCGTYIVYKCICVRTTQGGYLIQYNVYMALVIQCGTFNFMEHTTQGDSQKNEISCTEKCNKHSL